MELRIEVPQHVLGVRREVLIEQQSHTDGSDTNLRSRSAAKANDARMSFCSKSGKSD